MQIGLDWVSKRRPHNVQLWVKPQVEEKPPLRCRLLAASEPSARRLWQTSETEVQLRWMALDVAASENSVAVLTLAPPSVSNTNSNTDAWFPVLRFRSSVSFSVIRVRTAISIPFNELIRKKWNSILFERMYGYGKLTATENVIFYVSYRILMDKRNSYVLLKRITEIRRYVMLETRHNTHTYINCNHKFRNHQNGMESNLILIPFSRLL